VENLEEMDKFLHTYDLTKLNQEDINYLNWSITSNEIEAVIVYQQKSPRTDEFTAEFCQTFREHLTPMLLKLFHNIEMEGTLTKLILWHQGCPNSNAEEGHENNKNYRPIYW
jgi:hypothetical protein